jgi:hypothetical protein
MEEICELLQVVGKVCRMVNGLVEVRFALFTCNYVLFGFYNLCRFFFDSILVKGSHLMDVISFDCVL